MRTSDQRAAPSWVIVHIAMVRIQGVTEFQFEDEPKEAKKTRGGTSKSKQK